MNHFHTVTLFECPGCGALVQAAQVTDETNAVIGIGVQHNCLPPLEHVR